MPTDRTFYNVPPTSPDTLRNLNGPLDIPGRSKTHPPVYLWVGDGPHPQRKDGHENAPETAFKGKTYVVLVDSSDDGKEMTRRLGQAHKIPLGRDEVAINAGESYTCPCRSIHDHTHRRLHKI